EYIDWVVDTTNWIHRPKRTALYDASAAVLRERWLSYDGLAWGSLGSRSLLTREEKRLVGAQGTSGNPVVTSSYDAYGNRTATTDARGCTTTTGPLDTGSLYGSMSRFYLDFGNASAQRILTYRTTVHGTAGFIWNDDYFDGLGRNYLSRSQGPGSQTIQREITYDSRGLVAT